MRRWLDHWGDCSSHLGGVCDCGGITTAGVLLEFARWHAYNLAVVTGMFRLGFMRRAFNLHGAVPMPSPRWPRFPWPLR